MDRQPQVQLTSRNDPMSIIYSEIIWLGAVVLVPMFAALISLWSRRDPSAFEPVKPLRLSPAERELLLQERTSAIQKALVAKNAAKKARRKQRNSRAVGTISTRP